MITVLGSINIDLIATTAALPRPGETVAGGHFATAPGGKGANQALAARRAGAFVRMAGAVGRDAFAGEALQLLKAAGVDLTMTRPVDAPTGTALILVGGDGENMIAVVAGANGHVGEALAREAVSHMSKGDTLLLQCEIPAGAIEAALTAAREAGVATILNTAPLIEEAPRLAELAAVVVANETEFERLAGADSNRPLDRAGLETALKRFAGQRGQTVIVTLGADGVVAVEGGAVHHVKGLEIKPVDTVGAGDTFCGYLAAALDAKMTFPDALRRAAVAGSLACLKPGAQPSVPTAREVDAALAKA